MTAPTAHAAVPHRASTVAALAWAQTRSTAIRRGRPNSSAYPSMANVATITAVPANADSVPLAISARNATALTTHPPRIAAPTASRAVLNWRPRGATTDRAATTASTAKANASGIAALSAISWTSSQSSRGGVAHGKLCSTARTSTAAVGSEDEAATSTQIGHLGGAFIGLSLRRPQARASSLQESVQLSVRDERLPVYQPTPAKLVQIDRKHTGVSGIIEDQTPPQVRVAGCQLDVGNAKRGGQLSA